MSGRWIHKAQLRHLFTKEEDYESVKKSMADIADAIKTYPFFSGFNVVPFYKILQGDDIISPLDYANKLINRMWDFCDENNIWIDF
jgi:hypothetical protein